MQTVIIEIGSTNVVTLTALQDITTLAYPIDATVVGTLLDIQGQPVSGVDPIAFAHVDGTIGAESVYRGMIPASAPIVPQLYKLRVTVTDAGGQISVFTVTAAAQEH